MVISGVWKKLFWARKKTDSRELVMRLLYRSEENKKQGQWEQKGKGVCESSWDDSRVCRSTN